MSQASTTLVRPPRIVLATDRLSPGGVSHFVLQLANHFRARGCQVDVMSLRPGEWDHRLVESGVDVHTVPSRKVVELIRSADVIHCQQRILGLLAVLLGARARTIEHVHNVMSGHRLLSFRASTIIAVSNHVRSGLQSHYPRLANRHLSVVSNGARKRPGDPLPFGRRCYDIVGVGRFEEQKDPLAFLDLVARLHRHNAGLRAVWIAPGAGSLQQQFIDHQRLLGLNDVVTVAQGGTHEATRDLIAQSKVFLMTSKWEGLPLAALEALASGTPVVTTPCGEIADIIGNGGCGAVLDSDLDAGTSALISLTCDRSLWESNSANAFSVADDFSEDGMTAMVERIYRSVQPNVWPDVPDSVPSEGGVLCES
ncbi:glycosyltransferase family 4 protein [Mycolicibacterium gadium]|uniref:glycosyltransferase family 4 protein n=1 Tax=Mycolicibacterium gadium TaxID=1794 RepID=UPI002FDD1D16